MSSGILCRNCGKDVDFHDDELCDNIWKTNKEKQVARMIGNGKGESCGSCKFFFADEGDRFGACRLNPPNENEGFPTVRTNNWCGQYKKEPEDDELMESVPIQDPIISKG